jgi:hypothetical protein
VEEKPHPNLGRELSMFVGKHYVIEETPDGKFAVRAMDSEKASDVLDTQAEAIAIVKTLNPNDHPYMARMRKA